MENCLHTWIVELWKYRSKSISPYIIFACTVPKLKALCHCLQKKVVSKSQSFLKFMYSEKATQFRVKVKISQNFVAFSEYMNFNCHNLHYEYASGLVEYRGSNLQRLLNPLLRMNYEISVKQYFC